MTVMPERSSSGRVLPSVKPALAHPGSPEDLDRAGFLWSPKLDGVRCLAFCDGADVRLINRRYVDITHRYPDVVTVLQEQVGSPCVLDGELIALDGEGKPSFTLIAQRDQASKPATIAAAVQRVPVCFMVFDLPMHDGQDVRNEQLQARLRRLEALGAAWSGGLQVVPHVPHGRALWAAVVEQNLEGVVGKEATSRYVGTRTKSWIKVKTLHRVSCVAISYDTGEGSRAGTIGAIHLSMFDTAGQLVPVGRVGTGFNGRSLAECKELLDAGQPFVAEVECLSLGTGRQLRHPSFKGIRRDLGPADCVVSQLDTLPRT